MSGSRLYQEAKLRKKVRERDRECVMNRILTEEEKAKLMASLNWRTSLGPLEVCHVVAKSQSRALRYEISNAVLMHQLYHRRLTELRCPITGKRISQKEVDAWMRRLQAAALGGLD